MKSPLLSIISVSMTALLIIYVYYTFQDCRIFINCLITILFNVMFGIIYWEADPARACPHPVKSWQREYAHASVGGTHFTLKDWNG
jgi:hypothetical protein